VKFHGSSLLVASSSHPRRHARHPCGDVGRVEACHALSWLVDRRSAGVYSTAHLAVCRVVLQIPRAQHARPVAGILAVRMPRGCHEETASVEFKLKPLHDRFSEKSVRACHRRMRLAETDRDVMYGRPVNVFRRVRPINRRPLNAGPWDKRCW